MPGVPTPSTDWLAAKFTNLQNQITAIATQQNQSIIDPNLVTRAKIGWQSEFNTYGIAIFDASGNRRAMFGELPDGNHGVAIYDQNLDGGYVELNAPESAGWNSTTLSTTSTTDTTLANSPSLTVSTGASAKCLVMVSAILGNTAGDGAVMSVYADGVYTGLAVSLQSPSAVQATGANNQVVSGLAKGSHALALEYRSVSGATANFSHVSLTATPY